MKIIVSACLLGDNVKYNGKNNKNDKLIDFLKDYEVIKICPEVMGGLSIPRLPSEIRDNKVINQKGRDVTLEYTKGAQEVLEIIKKQNMRIAILKQNSPSCGSTHIYDGTFSHNLISGEGITTKLLKENGIIVFDENNYEMIKEVYNG